MSRDVGAGPTAHGVPASTAWPRPAWSAASTPAGPRGPADERLVLRAAPVVQPPITGGDWQPSELDPESSRTGPSVHVHPRARRALRRADAESTSPSRGGLLRSSIAAEQLVLIEQANIVRHRTRGRHVAIAVSLPHALARSDGAVIIVAGLTTAR
jgi:hypothetical protein